MPATRLSQISFEAINAHAREAYPEECCGIVLVINGQEEVRQITNLQNRLHAEDPKSFPRNAMTAYFMDPTELAAALQDSERPGGSLRLFYHSHPDHDAYFSEEDKAAATPFGEPSYPDARYLVVSVTQGEPLAWLLVSWNATEEDYVELPLELV